MREDECVGYSISKLERVRKLPVPKWRTRARTSATHVPFGMLRKRGAHAAAHAAVGRARSRSTPVSEY